MNHFFLHFLIVFFPTIHCSFWREWIQSLRLMEVVVNFANLGVNLSVINYFVIEFFQD